MASTNKPDKEQQLRWQAEEIVRQAITNTPQFKTAVHETMKSLKSLQKKTLRTVRRAK